MRHSVSQASAKADAAMKKANKAASSTNMAKWLDDYMHSGGHTIAIAWDGANLRFYVDGNNIRTL